MKNHISDNHLMTEMSPFNSNHKQKPEIPMTSNTLHKLRHHLFIQLGAVMLISLLIISAGAFYFVLQGDRNRNLPGQCTLQSYRQLGPGC